MAGARVIQRIGRYDIDVGFDLGSGALGTVFEGYVHGNEIEKVAVKRIKVLDEEEFTNEVEKEFHILQSMPRHINIVQVICMERSVILRDFAHIYMWMFMELCELGNMRSFCRENNLSIPQKVSMMCQCAEAVLFLHNQGIVHRDIKPQNILLTGDRTRPTVKLTDFGTARVIERIQGREKTMHSLVGTLPYMAPEFFSLVVDDAQPAYDKTADTFSLGLTFLAITEAKLDNNLKSFKVDGKDLGKHLWTTKQNVESIMKPDDPHFQRELKEIFTNMLRFEPTQRLSMEQVLQQLQEIKTYFSQPILVTVGGYIGGENGIPEELNIYISVNKHNQWLNITTRPDTCKTMGVMICAVEDGLLFIGGDIPGYGNGGAPVAQCQHYSLFYECWTIKADIPTPRAYGSAIAIRNDVYVMGGIGNTDGTLATCEKLDLKENIWYSLRDMLVPLSKPYLAIARGNIYILPTYHNNFKSSKCLLCYDPESDTFTEKTSLPEASSFDGGSFVSVNEMLYLFGAAENQFHQYNPCSDQWTAITRPSIPTTPKESNAAVTGSKIILFYESNNDSWEWGENKAEEYDTVNDSWSHCTTSLPQVMSSYIDAQNCCLTTFLDPVNL